MSEYRDFKKCVVCRTKQNLVNYQGAFEETMLLNSLYMAVMFPLETRRENGMAKSKIISRYLIENNIVNTHGNDFDSDTIIRCLRNAMAHYNVQVISTSKKISDIKLWSINRPYKPVCRQTSVCQNPKCRPVQYQTNEEGAICTFTFKISELRDFTLFVIDHALKQISDDICNGCIYKDNISTHN